jgi:glucosamine--fructose-6-phosphate aminotransferase (isomerizing)
MCGIFAYLNYGVVRDRQYIIDHLINGLRRLEYRGYDSAGLAVDNLPFDVDDFVPKEYAPIIIKAQGKIDNLVAEVRDCTDAIFNNLVFGRVEQCLDLL